MLYCGLMLTALFGASPVLAAGTLDQDFTPGIYTLNIPADGTSSLAARVQTFTVGIDGVLGSVDLVLREGSEFQGTLFAEDVEVEIRATALGIPTDTVLGTVSRPRSELGPLTGAEPLVEFDFSPLGISVQTGDVLAIYLTNASSGMWRLGAPEFEYLGGALFIETDPGVWLDASSLGDFGFRTSVVVPEPSTALLMGLALAVSLRRRVGVKRSPSAS